MKSLSLCFLGLFIACASASPSVARQNKEPLRTPEKFLIIANGSFDADVVLALMKDPHVHTVALDGAANHLYNKGLTPHYILGDFDSIKDETRRHFQNLKIQFIQAPDQNYTDLEKGIHFCAAQGAKDIVIACALGGERTDHALATLSLLKKHHDKPYKIRIQTPKESIEFLKGEARHVQGKRGEKFGIFGFPKARAWSKGLVWELNNYPLELGVQESACNVLKENSVSLRVQGEALMIRPLSPTSR